MSATMENRTNRRAYANVVCNVIPAERDIRIPARIYNLSQTGAAIEVNVFGKLPDVIGVDIDGKIYTAKIVWRKARNIGVTFMIDA